MKSLRLHGAALLIAPSAVLSGPAAPSFAHGHERVRPHSRAASTATPIFEHNLPNIPGKSLLAVEVVYPPGGASPAHRHPASAFIWAYVVSGEIVSAVDSRRPRIYQAGESFYEAPGAHHDISRNASSTRPAKLLAVFVKDSGKGQLLFPDRK